MSGSLPHHEMILDAGDPVRTPPDPLALPIAVPVPGASAPPVSFSLEIEPQSVENAINSIRTLLEAEVGGFEEATPAETIDLAPEASPLLAAPGTSPTTAPDLKATAPEASPLTPPKDNLEPATEPAPLPSRSPGSPPPSEVELELGALGRVLLRFDAAEGSMKLDIRADDPRTAALLQARKTEILEAVASSQSGASDPRTATDGHEHRSRRNHPWPRDMDGDRGTYANPRIASHAAGTTAGRGLIDIVA